MAIPSGFGLVQLFPGIIENPPGYAYFQTGGAGAIDAFIVSATGSPRLVYSLVSGSGATLNYISGNNNDFYFNDSRMMFGNSIPTAANRTQSGNLSIFWDGRDSSKTYAGLLISQTNSNANSGSPITVFRTNANVNDPLEISTHLGTKIKTRSSLGGYDKMDLDYCSYYHVANTYATDAYTTPSVGGANEPGSFGGFGFSRYDGAGNLYTNLFLGKEYSQIGHYLEDGTLLDFEGYEGALVLRQGNKAPNGLSHFSGISFFAPPDGTLRVHARSGVEVTLVPGISGINKLATSNDIYETLNYGGGTTFNVNMSHDGKKLVDTKAGSHTIYFDSSLLNDGFSCQILHFSSTIPTFDTNLASNQLLFASKEGGISTVKVYSGRIFIDTTNQPKSIYLGARDFYPRLNSGAATGLFETVTNRVNYPTLDFDQFSVEYAQADVVLPIDCSQFRAQFLWAAASGAGNVRWGIRAAALEDGEPLALTFSSAQYLVDSKVGTSGIQKTSFTSGFLPAGSLGDIINLPTKIECFRDASNVLDSLNADARLLGVILLPQ